MTRVPTEKQYDKLRVLGSGNAGLSWTKGEAEPLLRHGWITADFEDRYYQWVRITPAGLHALARAVEKYGLPDFASAFRRRKVCADCGSHKRACKACGGTHYRFEVEEIARPGVLA